MRAAPSIERNTEATAELRRFMVEVREMLVQLLHDKGDARAGARDGPLILGSETLIRLEDSVGLVWGASTARNPDSREAHVGILELFATKGLNGVILETTVHRKEWHTSREAVERFKSRAFGQEPQAPPSGGARTPRRRGRTT